MISNLISQDKSPIDIADDFVLKKDDESVIWSIDKCNHLRHKWVNYCGPIAYKEHNWEYYFLEYKAPWEELNFHSYGDNMSYKDAFDKYFSFLTLLSDAPQDRYNKFFQDIKEMERESLRPDCSNLWNLFFDPYVWFSFINAQACNNGSNSRLSVESIFNMILNPKFSYQGFSVLPKEEVNRYNKTISIIYGKIKKSLELYNYPDDEIDRYINQEMHTFPVEECINYKDIEKYIEKCRQKLTEDRSDIDLLERI